jgi:predicted lipid-binding transport protein (Tim44 family)
VQALAAPSRRPGKKARLGKAGLGKGGNLGMGSIYLFFFFAFFFAAIGLFSSCLED